MRIEKRPVAFTKETTRLVKDEFGNKKHREGTGKFRLTARCPTSTHNGEATVVLRGEVPTGIVFECGRCDRTFVADHPPAPQPQEHAAPQQEGA